MFNKFGQQLYRPTQTRDKQHSGLYVAHAHTSCWTVLQLHLYKHNPTAIKLQELIEATKRDAMLQNVVTHISSVGTSKLVELGPYKQVINELSIYENGIILRNNRIVIPESLKLRAAQLAHEGHQGCARQKDFYANACGFLESTR